MLELFNIIYIWNICWPSICGLKKFTSDFNYSKKLLAGIQSTCMVRIVIKTLKMAKKVTSKKAASAASKVLRDGRTSKASKTAAGSALSQREKSSKKK